MKDHLSRYTLRVEQILLDKLGYIAEYEGRTKNRELEQMIKKRIADFEKEHGEIRPNDQKKSPIRRDGALCRLVTTPDSFPSPC